MIVGRGSFVRHLINDVIDVSFKGENLIQELEEKAHSEWDGKALIVKDKEDSNIVQYNKSLQDGFLNYCYLVYQHDGIQQEISIQLKKQ